MPFSIDYQLNEEFGILKLIDSEIKKPVPKIYVKVFADYTNGVKKFYKDGYTDLRGCFDYVSLNRDKVNDIKQFKLFIGAGIKGDKILEAKPPVKIGKSEGEAKKIISKNWKQKQAVRSK